MTAPEEHFPKLHNARDVFQVSYPEDWAMKQVPAISWTRIQDLFSIYILDKVVRSNSHSQKQDRKMYRDPMVRDETAIISFFTGLLRKAKRWI